MLTDIKGIGPKMVETLKKIGINNVDDLINYYPFRYNILKNTPLKEGNVLISGIIETSPVTTYIKKNLNKLSFRLDTKEALVNIVIFNRAFMKTNLTRGKEISVIGDYKEKNNTITALDIRFRKIEGETIEPIYHLTSGISSRVLHSLIMNALEKTTNVIDYIPDYLVDEYSFQDKESSLVLIHNPNDILKVESAIERFKYEELFKFMFKINYLKNTRVDKTGLKRKTPKDGINHFIDSLPFKLTKDQLTSINDIVEDLSSEKRMNRLLLGDVGSGKTIVAICAIYYNYLSGYQSALLAPTEILAIQHFINITKLFKQHGIRVEVLTGSISKRERNIILNDLKNGDIDLLIGTHAVLENNVEFNNLGLVITDEQHRFGVNQRNTFQNKGVLSDVLYMSATPIPRTYALTIYGDMDISTIRTKPEGRKKIETSLVKFKDIKSVLMNMLEEIKKGHQIYVVAPMIETDEESNLTDVTELKNKIDVAFNNKIPSSVLHGKLKPKEKEEVMDDFKNGKIKILISTTVIEVGVDVKNATMMVIFNAERFGLATIHQLRGRIGRNDLDCKCIMISDKESERLKVLTESTDGFYIAEQDFKIRGEGDLFGTKQSGDMIFKIADLRNDIKILTKANVDSNKFILNNKKNNFKCYPMFKNIIKELEHID